MAKQGGIPEMTQSLMQANLQLQKLVKEYQSLQKVQKQIEKDTSKSTEQREKDLQQLDGQLDNVRGQIDAIKESGKTLDKDFNPEKIKVKPITQQFRELRREMADLADAGEMNSERFRELAVRSGEMRVAIADTNAQIQIMEATSVSAGVGLSTAFGQTARNIASLDFANAERSIKGMSVAMASINPQKMTKDFLGMAKAMGGTLVTGLKILGKGFLSLGKIILLNPIFLIATIVIAIVVALVNLGKKFTWIGNILKAIAAPIMFVIDLLKKLGQWLGLIDEDTQALTRSQRDLNLEYKKSSTEVLQEYQNSLNRQLKLIKAHSNLTNEQKKQVRELEVEVQKAEISKREQMLITEQVNEQALIAYSRAGGVQMKELKETQKKINELKESIQDAYNDLEVLNITHEEQITEDGRRAWEKRKSELEKQEQERLKLREQANEFLRKMEEELRLDQYKDEDERAYQQVKGRLEVEREQILKNTQLTEEERIKVVSYYAGLEQKSRDTFNQKRIEKEDALFDKISDMERTFSDKRMQAHIERLKNESEQTLNTRLELRKSEWTIQQQALEEERVKTIQEYEKLGLDTTEIEAFYQNQQKDQYQNYLNDLEGIRKEDHARQVQEYLSFYDKVSETIDNAFSFQNDELSKNIANIGTTLVDGLKDIASLMEDETATIADKAVAIAGTVAGTIQAVMSTLADSSKEALDSYLSNLSDAYDKENGLLQEKLNNGLISQEEADEASYRLAMEKYNAEEKAKKKAFDEDKKMQVAQASIAMFQGMVSAFSGAMKLGPILGPVMGALLAGAVATMGGINIAKIQAMDYKAGAKPEAPSVPSIGTPSTAGGGENVTIWKNNSGVGSEDKPIEPNGSNQNVNVTVSVSEITDVQNKVVNYDEINTL